MVQSITQPSDHLKTRYRTVRFSDDTDFQMSGIRILHCNCSLNVTRRDKLVLDSWPPVGKFKSKDRMGNKQWHQMREYQTRDNSCDNSGSSEHAGHGRILGLNGPGTVKKQDWLRPDLRTVQNGFLLCFITKINC